MGFRGNRGGTQGQPYDNEHGRPLPMLRKRQLVDIRKRSFTGSTRESELPIVPLVFQGQHNLGRGKGQYLHHASKGEKKKEIAVTLLTLNISGTPVGAILEGQVKAKASGRR